MADDDDPSRRNQWRLVRAVTAVVLVIGIAAVAREFSRGDVVIPAITLTLILALGCQLAWRWNKGPRV